MTFTNPRTRETFHFCSKNKEGQNKSDRILQVNASSPKTCPDCGVTLARDRKIISVTTPGVSTKKGRSSR